MNGASAQEKHLLKVFGNQQEVDRRVDEILARREVFTRRAAIMKLYQENRSENLGSASITGFYLGEFGIFGGDQKAFYLLTGDGVQEIRVADSEKQGFPAQIPPLSLVRVDQVSSMRDIERGTNYSMWGDGMITTLQMGSSERMRFLEWIQSTDDVGYEKDLAGNKALVKNSAHYLIEGKVEAVNDIKEDYNKETKEWAKTLKIFTSDGVNLRLRIGGETDKSARMNVKVVTRRNLIDAYGVDAPPKAQLDDFLLYLEEAKPEDQMLELGALAGKTLYLFGSGSKMVRGEQQDAPWFSIKNQGWIMDQDTLSERIRALASSNGAASQPAPAAVPVAAAAAPPPPQVFKAIEAIEPPVDAGPSLNDLFGDDPAEADPDANLPLDKRLLKYIGMKGGPVLASEIQAWSNDYLDVDRKTLAATLLNLMESGAVKKDKNPNGHVLFTVPQELTLDF